MNPKPSRPAAEPETPAVPPPDADALAPLDGTEPPRAIDADWAAHERAAERDPHDDPSDELKDRGVLESLGEAISAPMRDAGQDELPPQKRRDGQ